MRNLADAASSHSLNTEAVWAIIPARGGSKRLPRKNVMPFAGGESLTERTVRTAIASGCFARVVVSTDDPEIADAGRRAGAMVPFLRPAHLADDRASSVDVLIHAVEELHRLEGSGPAAICLLQVTSPLLLPGHVRDAVSLFTAGGFNSLSTMTAVEQYPEWMFRVDAGSGLAIPESAAGITMPTAAIPKRCIENGALYLVKAEWLSQHGSLYDFANHGCFEMSREESVDIDTRSDWDYAEMLVTRQKCSAVRLPDGS